MHLHHIYKSWFIKNADVDDSYYHCMQIADAKNVYQLWVIVWFYKNIPSCVRFTDDEQEFKKFLKLIKQSYRYEKEFTENTQSVFDASYKICGAQEFPF